MKFLVTGYLGHHVRNHVALESQLAQEDVPMILMHSKTQVKNSRKKSRAILTVANIFSQVRLNSRLVNSIRYTLKDLLLYYPIE